ncbi:alpha-ketoacid dehydrogenase subunit beta [Alkaliphilus peptidifermentans]|uniref:Pyruvate dehydrogenase E1 component beta subunit n=1 Tax=Alkaliphilus peptidifermentans DSM 18978 TaxID=1120976 RepID=A0A1G5L2A2_9FIRM|nr:alpha-ketoacid dehydrogenase subunit beta [Alkaliphilus peptidifermentans]SCZ06498.1 pyruvate dehydrogenase E1 component beta subunit [Alkaliphilus peptidifermentans DSM 18978]
MPLMNILNAVNHALDHEMERDKTVVVYGEDVGHEGGVFRATVGLQQKYGKERCFDSPLAEAGIVGSAIGMAVNGLKPVVEMQFSGFILPAINQIIAHAARMRNRSRGKYHLPMVIRTPYGGGIRALEHHSENLEAIFAHTPGLKVVIPSTPYDTKGLLLAAIRDPDPVIFLEPKRIYRAFKQEVPEDDYVIPIGKAKIVKEGKDVTVVTYGAMVSQVQEAVKQLEKEGIAVELIDLRTISPIDKDTIIKSVKKTGRFVAVHEAVKSFSVSAELISIVNEEAFLYLEAPPTRITGFDITVPLPRGEHHYLINPDRIVSKIKEIVEY